MAKKRAELPAPTIPPCVLFCDGVIVEQGTGKATLVGTFSGVAAEPFPSPPKDLHVYAQVTSLVGDMRVRLTCLQLGGAEAEEVYSTEHVVRFHGKLIVEQVHFVWHQFQNCVKESQDSSEIEALRSIAAGVWHPDDENEAAQSVRDTQYELWLLSQFRMRGIPAHLTEPDLRISWRGLEYPVAAKRPRSRRSLDGRVHSATRQLDGCTTGGLVAISVDLLLRPRRKVLNVASPLEASHAMDLIFLDLLKWLISAEAPLSKRSTGHNAIAFLVTGTLPSFIIGAGVFSLETRCQPLFVKTDQRTANLIGFREVFGSYADHL